MIFHHCDTKQETPDGLAFAEWKVIVESLIAINDVSFSSGHDRSNHLLKILQVIS